MIRFLAMLVPQTPEDISADWINDELAAFHSQRCGHRPGAIAGRGLAR